MKHIKLFEEFVNEAKSFQFSFNYNTDDDDVEYIQNILMDSGADAIAEPGIDSEEMVVKAHNAVELRKAKKAIQADGFEINESNAKGPGFKIINKSYPQHIKVLKKLYLVWDDDAEWYDWSDKPGKKMNGELKKGEEFFFSHIYKPNNVAADGINYKDKNGKHGPEFVPADLERLVHDNAIQIVESVNESQTFIKESAMGDVYVMAGEADSFTAFRKEFMDEYGKPKSVKELKALEAWLQTIWNENQTNESTLNERNTKLYVYPTSKKDHQMISNWLQRSDFHAEENSNYFMFPVEGQRDADNTEMDLDKEFNKLGASVRYELE